MIGKTEAERSWFKEAFIYEEIYGDVFELLKLLKQDTCIKNLFNIFEQLSGEIFLNNSAIT